MVPSEFKKIVVPYREIEKADVERLKEMFRQRASAII